MIITKELIQQLREETGEGMMSCKKALTHYNGDIERAKAYLHSAGRLCTGWRLDRV